ncbi:hypothetical protein JOQ06_001833, partial [Pogonophryne albipinna]
MIKRTEEKDDEKTLPHSEILDIFEEGLSQLVKDPLLCDLPIQVHLEEVNSQIALEYGQAMTVRVLKADGEILPIAVVQNATVLDLKKASDDKMRLKDYGIRKMDEVTFMKRHMKKDTHLMDQDGASCSSMAQLHRMGGYSQGGPDLGLHRRAATVEVSTRLPRSTSTARYPALRSLPEEDMEMKSSGSSVPGVPLLKPVHVQARLKFAREHLDDPEEDWENVICVAASYQSVSAVTLGNLKLSPSWDSYCGSL